MNAGGYLLNSLITAVCSTIIAVILGSLAAYAIQRSGAKLSVGLVVLILCLKMIPTSSIAVPIYEIICNMGLYDTRIALIIVYAAVNMPFVMWTMLSFYEGVPSTLDEAAYVDGASSFRHSERLFCRFVSRDLQLPLYLHCSWHGMIFLFLCC